MVYRRKKNFTTTRNRQRDWLRLLFWFTATFFFGVVMYILFFSQFLAITSFGISGNKDVAENDILDQIRPGVTGKFGGIIDKNNLLLLRNKKVRKDILDKFRQVRSVEVRKKFPAQLEVRIVERVPTLLFHSADEWFILDENAVAYDYVNPEAKEIVAHNLPALCELEGKDIGLGTQVLNKDYLVYILGLNEKIKNYTEVEIENKFETRSLISKDIRIKAKEGWGIYFNESLNLDKEIEMLNAVLEKKIEKEKRPDLEYIDLRIDNKVYYKFHEGTPEETARLAAEEAAENETTVAIPDKTEKNKKN